MARALGHPTVDPHQDVAVLKLIGALVRGAHHEQAFFGAKVAAEPRGDLDQLELTKAMTGAEEMLEGWKRNDVREHCDLGQIEAVAKHGEERRFGSLGRDRRRLALVAAQVVDLDLGARVDLAQVFDELCRRGFVAGPLERLAVDRDDDVGRAQARCFGRATRAHAHDLDARVARLLGADIHAQHRAAAPRTREPDDIALVIAVELPAQIGDLARRRVEARLRLGQRFSQLFTICLRLRGKTGGAHRRDGRRKAGDDHRVCKKPFHRQNLRDVQSGAASARAAVRARPAAPRRSAAGPACS